MSPTETFRCRFVLPSCVCIALMSFSVFAAAPDAGMGPNMLWDWTGIIGTGQSLSIGARGRPIVSTSQPYNNLKLSTGNLPWPIDPDNLRLELVPLTEPVGRYSTSYPSAWPTNIDGETWHSAMANEVTALVRRTFNRDYLTVHCEVGEDGQGMVFIKKNAVAKGVNGRSYLAAMIETKAIARLAKTAGKTFGVGAIVVTHGESDAGNIHYEEQLHQLWQDYNTDLAAITGQTHKIQMILSQQNAVNNRSPSTLAQWKIGLDYPADIVCSGPKYQYPSAEGVHLTTEGYRQLGEKYGQVYFERVILGKDWEPLEPLKAERNGTVITVYYHVPVGPMVWETSFDPPHQSAPEWKEGKGFEINTSSGGKVSIASVKISGDSVAITCASDPGPDARVGYAMIGEKNRMAAPFHGIVRWGLLRDSDLFQGAVTGKTQPNYAVAFEMSVP